MDPNTYAKEVFGLKPGDPVTPAMAAQINKELEYYRKKTVDAMVAKRFETPKVLQTTKGLYAQYDGTNAVAIAPVTTNAKGEIMRGETLRGYAADEYADGVAPVPTIMNNAFGVTNATTNAPTATPSPTPYPEGAKIRSKRDGLLYQVVNGVPQLIPGQ